MAEDGFHHCSRCQAKSVDRTPLGLQLGHRTSDNFHFYHPTCKHGPFLICHACQSSAWKSQNYQGCACPVCGCEEFYT